MPDEDADFLREMITHHKGALKMASDYLASTSPTVRTARVADLARAIVKAQTTEIATIQGWLRSEGKPPTAMAM